VHTKFMKWIAVVTLFLAVLGFPIVSHKAILEIVVCVSALLVVAQAILGQQVLLGCRIFDNCGAFQSPPAPSDNWECLCLARMGLPRRVSRLTSHVEVATDTLCAVNHQPGSEK
jgi:hypothetical protein